MRIIFLSCFLIGILSSVYSQKVSINTNNISNGIGHVKFVVQEINSLFIPKMKKNSNKQIHFVLERDSLLKDGGFSYEIKKNQHDIWIKLKGETVTEINHALHQFLEDVGYDFEISGTYIPKSIDLERIKPGVYATRPSIRWRGIRQHVNFPMDISSYPLHEAENYLRQLMRMKYNEIAIHSYPNLWHEVYTGDSTEIAGNFFYNRPHEIPDIPVIQKNIRFNKKYFSIPEIEKDYENVLSRSKGAIKWMKDLLSYAKYIGFKVHFSIEPRRKGDIEYIVENCKSAIQNYPMIDELEINTEELGGWGNACSDTTVKQILEKRFGREVLLDTFITKRIQKNQTDLDNLVDQIGRNIHALKKIHDDTWFKGKNIPIQLGIYCTIPEFADIAYHLVRKYSPETIVSIMPGHGSQRTANHFSQIHKTKEDLKQTTVVSWIEFDGLMFSLQNPIKGISSMFQYLDSFKMDEQIPAVLFNHWRTAESMLGAKYAIESSLKGYIPKETFYLNYAVKFGLSKPLMFVSAMEELEKINEISTNELPNYGFCWLGAWTNGGPYTWMNRQKLKEVKKIYENVFKNLQECSKTTSSDFALKQMEFIKNRIQTSIEYINAFELACQIQDIKPNSKGFYNEGDKQKALEIFNNAFNSYQKYMNIHTRMMPDRGCEGTLINLWHGPIYGLRVLREKITHIPIKSPLNSKAFQEGPPLPILIK